jgi:hypothetical protein
VSDSPACTAAKADHDAKLAALIAAQEAYSQDFRNPAKKQALDTALQQYKVSVVQEYTACSVIPPRP